MGVVKDECSKSLCWRPLQLSGKKKTYVLSLITTK